MTQENGKGDRDRVTDIEAFVRNFEQINWQNDSEEDENENIEKGDN